MRRAFLAAPPHLREDDRLPHFLAKRQNLLLDLRPVRVNFLPLGVRRLGKLVIGSHPHVVELAPETDLRRLVMVPVRRIRQRAAIILPHLFNHLQPALGMHFRLDQLRPDDQHLDTVLLRDLREVNHKPRIPPKPRIPILPLRNNLPAPLLVPRFLQKNHRHQDNA